MAGTPDAPSMVYDTSPLPLGTTMCIRVIKIRPNLLPDLSDDLVCDMSILDVDSGGLWTSMEVIQQPGASSRTSDHSKSPQPSERIQYQALSYTWGDTLANWTIILNGLSLQVRENLWSFLQEARRCKVEKYLWIDAICINQTTVREKNHQVGMMGDIYSGAESVIVWLGNRSTVEEEELKTALDKTPDFTPVSTGEDEYPPNKEQRAWVNIMYRFGNLAYWRRAWIVQEFYLATQKQAWYGHLRIDPKWIKAMVETYNANTNEWILPYNKAAGFMATQERFDSPVRFGTFTNLVKLFQDSECGDRRDRVFALLPLLSLKEREELGISPDYSRSATSIFLQLAKTLTTEWDRSQRESPFELLQHLELMLRPNLQDRAVQMAILSSIPRAKVHEPHRHFYKEHHPCTKRNEWRFCVVDAKGCSYCSNRPVLSLNLNRLHIDDMEEFDRDHWEDYVKALLASYDEEDRDLGVKYRSYLNFWEIPLTDTSGRKVVRGSRRLMKVFAGK